MLILKDMCFTKFLFKFLNIIKNVISIISNIYISVKLIYFLNVQKYEAFTRLSAIHLKKCTENLKT